MSGKANAAPCNISGVNGSNAQKIFAGTVICPKTPVTLSNYSEPEPDITAAVGKIDDYVDHHPWPSEILLIAEVADDSLPLDKGLKLRIYAEAGIAEYWIVNLINRQLEVYREPSPAGIYAESRVYLPGESVEPLNAPGKSVAVADLLPPVKQEL